MLPNHLTLKSRSRTLRRDATTAEQAMWAALRNRRFVGFKFRRQHRIGFYIADFYCHEIALIVELDGDIHIGREVRDRRRQEWLEGRGHLVLRFFNTDVTESLDDVMECIFRTCMEREAANEVKPTNQTLTTSPSPGVPGEGSNDPLSRYPGPGLE